MGCADYRLYCDGDSDGDGNDLLHGVLDEKSVLEFDFLNALALFCFLGGGRDATTMANFRLVVTKRTYLSLLLRAKSWKKVAMD